MLVRLAVDGILVPASVADSTQTLGKSFAWGGDHYRVGVYVWSVAGIDCRAGPEPAVDSCGCRLLDVTRLVRAGRGAPGARWLAHSMVVSRRTAGEMGEDEK